MKIIEYRKNLIAGEIRDPDFIVNGGHWYDAETDTYIAVLQEPVRWYLPDTLTILTPEELIARVQRLNQIQPWPKRVGILGSGGREIRGTRMSDTDVEEMVSTWLLNNTL
jgi:hypothetical protein